MKNWLRKKYDNSPKGIKKIFRFFYNLLGFIPFTKYFKKRKWLKKTYNKFGQEQRKNIFLSIARFCQINRPINGYYFEFGCCGARTMKMAWNAFHYLFDWTYVGFDSFEGFPEISKNDEQELFIKGGAKIEEEDFIKAIVKNGMPKKKLIIVKGFYNESLTPQLKEKLSGQKAAVIYIDCDLYDSTVPVLNFIKDFLQKGTIIIFDDWNCFYGDPNKGERRAFKEFQENNSDLIFEDFVQTNEAKSFIFLGKKTN